MIYKLKDMNVIKRRKKYDFYKDICNDYKSKNKKNAHYGLQLLLNTHLTMEETEMFLSTDNLIYSANTYKAGRKFITYNKKEKSFEYKRKYTIFKRLLYGIVNVFFYTLASAPIIYIWSTTPAVYIKNNFIFFFSLLFILLIGLSPIFYFTLNYIYKLGRARDLIKNKELFCSKLPKSTTRKTQKKNIKS